MALIYFSNIYAGENFEGISPIHYEEKSAIVNGSMRTRQGYVEGRESNADASNNNCLWKFVNRGAYHIPTGKRYLRVVDNKLVEFVVRAIHYSYVRDRSNLPTRIETVAEIANATGEVEYTRLYESEGIECRHFPFYSSVEHYMRCLCGEDKPLYPDYVHFYDSFEGHGYEQYYSPNCTPHFGFAWRYKMDKTKGELVRKPCGFKEIIVVGDNAYVILDDGNGRCTTTERWYISKEECIKANMAKMMVTFGGDEFVKERFGIKVELPRLPKTSKTITIELKE